MQNPTYFFKIYSEFVFRVMLSLIFIVAGGNHLFVTSGVKERLLNTDLGTWFITYLPTEPLIILAGIGLCIGGLSLLVGFKTEWAALGLLAIIIPITVVVQTQGLQTLGPLFKNVGLTGGLIYFWANGSTQIALDTTTDLTKTASTQS